MSTPTAMQTHAAVRVSQSVDHDMWAPERPQPRRHALVVIRIPGERGAHYDCRCGQRYFVYAAANREREARRLHRIHVDRARRGWFSDPHSRKHEAETAGRNGDAVSVHAAIDARLAEQKFFADHPHLRHRSGCAACGRQPGEGRVWQEIYMCSDCDPDGLLLRRRSELIAPHYDASNSIGADVVCDRCLDDVVTFTNIRLCKPCWRDAPFWTRGLARYQSWYREASA